MYAVLPVGSAIPVSGVFVAPDGEQQLYVGLTDRLEPVAPGPHTAVDVRIGGRLVGRLSPESSAELAPIVAYLRAQGVEPMAHAVLRGNRLHGVLTLYAARTADIPADWLADPPLSTTPPT